MFDEILVDMYKPNCEKPVLLVNRAALNYAKLGAEVYGEVKHYINAYSIKAIKQGVLLKYAVNNLDNLDDCFVKFPNGYCEPLFIYAPCGHCTLCRESKRNDLVFRSIMESACYSCPPVFFTLTYDNEHLPCLEFESNNVHYKYPNQSKGELRYKDIQDFFKRLRRKWDRQGIKHNIRYLVAGEYGSKFGRPHYHIILWNNPYNADENNPLYFRKLQNDIFTAWGKCQLSGFDFGQCRGGASAYAAKYVSKPCKMHGHHIKPFIHCSNGNGGLGSPLLKKLKKYLRDNPQLREVTFRGFNGDLFEIGFSSYIVSQVWPSPSRLVNSRLRNLYKQYCDILSVCQSLGIMTYKQCYDLAELINPAPSIIPNQYNPVVEPVVCSTVVDLIYKPLLLKSLRSISDELCFLDDIDEKYYKKYFGYRQLQPAVTSPTNTASQVLRIQNKLATITDKEIF